MTYPLSIRDGDQIPTPILDEQTGEEYSEVRVNQGMGIYGGIPRSRDSFLKSSLIMFV